MEELTTIVSSTLKIAEKTMSTLGYCNPKIVFFYGDGNSVKPVMIDLSAEKLFSSQEDIAKKIVAYIKENKELQITMAVYYGECSIEEDGVTKDALCAFAMNRVGEFTSQFLEVQRYIAFDHPERQFFNLAPLTLKKTENHKTLETLIDNL